MADSTTPDDRDRTDTGTGDRTVPGNPDSTVRSELAARPFRRFVAVGDSFTEGVGDERSNGTPRGWADRAAPLLADRYANFAVRGKLLGPIIDDQLEPALACQPDLVSFAGGANDLLRPRASLPALVRLLDLVVARLTDRGATVLLFTWADPTEHLPSGARIRARGNALSVAVRELAERRGTVLVDLWAVPELRDRRYWAADRMHLGPLGHQAVAARVVTALGGSPDPAWSTPLPDDQRLPEPTHAEQLAYYRQHVGPWIKRRLTGTSSGDNRSAKLPQLVEPRDDDLAEDPKAGSDEESRN